MAMLSKILRFKLADKKGRSVRLADLSVALLESDYPPVTNLFYKKDKKFMRLPWKKVESFDLREKRFKVSDLDQAEDASLEAGNEYVLLKNEILDALIIDLENRTSFRANDLRLEKNEDKLELVAVDSSISAILRRVSFGFYNYLSRNGLFDWKYVEFLRGTPEAARNGAGYHLRITRMPPGEIARLANYLPYLHAAELITLLPDEKAAKALEIMPLERQLQVFEELDEDGAVNLLALMSPDAATDLVGLLETGMMKKYLERLPRKQAERIVELLRYPEDTVGGIMTNDIVCLPENMTVAEARRQLREHFSQTGFIYLIYIVKNKKERTLRGVISMRNLIIEDDGKKLKEIMDPYVSTLHALDNNREAAFRVIDSQLPAMPVVGAKGELFGAVTIDEAIMQIAPSSGAEPLRIFS